MTPKGTLCISTYVFGTYTKYIPYYVYSILKSYPDYHVKIFIDKELSLSEKKCLALIKNELSDNFSICENFFPEYDFLNDIRIYGGGKTILRYLIPENMFEGYDYIYIGDVDFLIIREDPGLLESHLNHCERIQLPFSNKIRLIPNSDNYTDRLTGLHFIIKKPYYEKIGPTISYLKDRNKLIEFLSGLKHDEQFLYYLVKQGFNFDNLRYQDAFRPHHGIHLGLGREKRSPSGVLKGLNNAEKYESLRLDDARDYLRFYLQDYLFQKLLQILPEESIFNICDALDVKMPNFKLKLRSTLNRVCRILWSPEERFRELIQLSRKNLVKLKI
jgi:hypothetical protein